MKILILMMMTMMMMATMKINDDDDIIPPCVTTVATRIMYSPPNALNAATDLQWTLLCSCSKGVVCALLK